MEAFECSGVWWPAEAPANRLPGTLHFSREKGLVLSLLGNFSEASWPLGEQTYRVVLGVAYDSPFDQQVTLKDCRLSGSTVGIPGFSRETYHVERAFFGAHLEEEEDFLFPECTIELGGLESWASHRTGFQFNRGPSREDGISLTYKHPPSLAAAVPEGTVALSWGARFKSTLRRWNFQEDVSFRVVASAPLSEGEWNQRYVYPLENFLTFATNAPNALRKVQFHRVLEGANPKEASLPIVLVASRVHEGPNEEEFSPHKMLFTLEDVGDRFAPFVRKWLEIHRHFQATCNVFFSIQYAPQTYLDTTLLAVMQSLELYQARRNGAGARLGKPSLPADVLANLPEACRSPIQEWLEGLVVDTFRGTLSQLFDEHRAVLGPLAPRGEEGLTGEVLAIRNQVLRKNLDPSQLGNYNLRLFWVTQTLTILMKACFLKELGFTEEERTRLFDRNQMYGFIRYELPKRM